MKDRRINREAKREGEALWDTGTRETHKHTNIYCASVSLTPEVKRGRRWVHKKSAPGAARACGGAVSGPSQRGTQGRKVKIL